MTGRRQVRPGGGDRPVPPRRRRPPRRGRPLPAPHRAPQHSGRQRRGGRLDRLPRAALAAHVGQGVHVAAPQPVGPARRRPEEVDARAGPARRRPRHPADHRAARHLPAGDRPAAPPLPDGRHRRPGRSRWWRRSASPIPSSSVGRLPRRAAPGLRRPRQGRAGADQPAGERRQVRRQPRRPGRGRLRRRPQGPDGRRPRRRQGHPAGRAPPAVQQVLPGLRGRPAERVGPRPLHRPGSGGGPRRAHRRREPSGGGLDLLLHAPGRRLREEPSATETAARDAVGTDGPLDAELARAADADRQGRDARRPRRGRADLRSASARPTTAANQGIKDLAADDRPKAGQAVSAVQGRGHRARRGRAGRPSATAPAKLVDRLDLTLPGRGPGRGHLHLITQVQQELEEVFLGLGYEVAEGPEVETDFYNFEALNMPAGPPGPVDVGHPLRQARPARGGGAAHPHLPGADPGHGGAPAARLHGHARAAATGATRSTPATRPSSTRSRASSSTRASPSATWPAPSTPSPGPTSARATRPGCGPATSPSPSRAPSSRSPASPATAPAARSARRRAGSSSAAAGWSTPTCSGPSATTPRRYTGFAFGFGLERMAMVRYGVEHIKSFFENDVRFLGAVLGAT